MSVRRPFKTKDGTKYDYFSCSAFDKSAEFIEEYIEKGDCVGIEGILLNDNYENEDGMTMYRDKINLDKIELLRSQKKGNSDPRRRNSRIKKPSSRKKSEQRKREQPERRNRQSRKSVPERRRNENKKRNLVDEEFERVQESEYNNYGFD